MAVDMSNEALREELISFGLDCPPVTVTTRAVLIKKLLSLRDGAQSMLSTSVVSDSYNDSLSIPDDVVEATPERPNYKSPSPRHKRTAERQPVSVESAKTSPVASSTPSAGSGRQGLVSSVMRNMVRDESEFGSLNEALTSLRRASPSPSPSRDRIGTRPMPRPNPSATSTKLHFANRYRPTPQPNLAAERERQTVANILGWTGYAFAGAAALASGYLAHVLLSVVNVDATVDHQHTNVVVLDRFATTPDFVKILLVMAVVFFSSLAYLWWQHFTSNRGRQVNRSTSRPRTSSGDMANEIESEEEDDVVARIASRANQRSQANSVVGDWRGSAVQSLSSNMSSNSPIGQRIAPTSCLKIRHVFPVGHFKGSSSSSKEDHVKEARIMEQLVSKVNNSCSDSSATPRILHMGLDRNSREGIVYMRCATNDEAGTVFSALHGQWYGSNMLEVKHVRLSRYLQRFRAAPY